MDWTTIRVLSDNLGDLLDQYKRGAHLEMRVDDLNPKDGEKERLKEEWWVGIRGVSASLARELSLDPQQIPNLNSGIAYLLVLRGSPDDPHLRQVTALSALARKLLDDDYKQLSIERAAESS